MAKLRDVLTLIVLGRLLVPLSIIESLIASTTYKLKSDTSCRPTTDCDVEEDSTSLCAHVSVSMLFVRRFSEML